MGVNGVLPKILPSAGRENYDLRALQNGIVTLHHAPTTSTTTTTHDDNSNKKQKNKWTRRKVRIAIDVNGWIARAAHGYGGSLMDERHLSYHGRASLRNEQRLQQEGEGKQPEDEDEEPPTNNNPPNNKDQQKKEYIVKCISFVLDRIDFLRNECCALVLPILDGATPPCKIEAVRERSRKRKRAVEQRDEVAQSPQRRADMVAEQQEEEEEAQEEDEAARTEAEVLRRISASRRAGTGKDYSIRRAMLDELLKEFRKRKWPFVVSPYEADGQLAYLANTGGVDLVVTEDSDLIALGVPKLVYKMGGWNGNNASNRSLGAPNYFGNQVNAKVGLRGTLLQRSDLGSSQGINLQDFSDAMLATMFVSAGCDYCDSLKGIGIITARNVVKKGFHGREASDVRGYSRSSDVPVLKTILTELFKLCHKDARDLLLPLDDPEKEDVRLAYEHSFLAALAMFRHPLVYDPILCDNMISNDVSDGSDQTAVNASFLRDEKILMEYKGYRDLVTNKDMLYKVIGAPFAQGIAKSVAEGIIDPRQVSALQLEEKQANEAEGNSSLELQTQEENLESEEAEGNSSLELQTQELSRAGTQQSTQQSKSSGSGMISSLSPDLLAPSP